MCICMCIYSEYIYISFIFSHGCSLSKTAPRSKRFKEFTDRVDSYADRPASKNHCPQWSVDDPGCFFSTDSNWLVFSIPGSQPVWTGPMLAMIGFQLYQQPAKPVAGCGVHCKAGLGFSEQFPHLIHCSHRPVNNRLHGFVLPDDLEKSIKKQTFLTSNECQSSGLSSTLVLFSWVNRSRASTCTLAGNPIHILPQALCTSMRVLFQMQLSR